jgi:hypothetical protein
MTPSIGALESDMIVCKCPACGKAYKVADEMGGRSAKCPCGTRFVIGRPMEAPVAAEAVKAPEPAPVVSESPEPAKATEPAAPTQEPQTSFTPVAPEPVKVPEPALPKMPAEAAPKPVIQPAKITAFAPQARPVAPAPAKAKPEDDGYGGIGRGIFVGALVGVSLIAMLLAYLGRPSEHTVMRMLFGMWALISVLAIFVAAQARLINLGYNEWLALLVAAPIANIWLIGGCSVLPEGFKDRSAKDPEFKSRSKSLTIGAILVGLAFYAVMGGFAFYLW